MGLDNTNQRSRRLLGHSWITLSASKVQGHIPQPRIRWLVCRLLQIFEARPGCNYRRCELSHGREKLSLAGITRTLRPCNAWCLDLSKCCKVSLGQNAATLGGSRPLTVSCSYTEIMPAHSQGLGTLSAPPPPVAVSVGHETDSAWDSRLMAQFVPIQRAGAALVSG